MSRLRVVACTSMCAAPARAGPGSGSSTPDTGDEIYAFCGFAEPADLVDIWFGTRAGFAPPRNVYVELLDQQAVRSVSSDPVTVCPGDYGPGCTS